MASRYFKQFLYSFNPMLTYIEGSFKVGVAGAVTADSFIGTGMSASSTLAVQKKSTGTYLLQLSDKYNRLVGFDGYIIPPVGDRALPDGSSAIVLGKSYQIVNASTSTNWVTLGVPSNVTPVAGVPFVASSASSNTPGSSTPSSALYGTMSLIGDAAIDHIRILPNVHSMLAPSSASSGFMGAYIMFETRLSSSAAPVNATSGTVIRFNTFLRNSSLRGMKESSTAN